MQNVLKPNLMPTVVTLSLSMPEAEGKEQEQWSLV